VRGAGLLLAAAALAWPLATPARAQEGDGGAALVERLHAVLIGVMKDAEKLGYEGRAEALRPVVPACYDIAFMARKSVGSHWKGLSEEEQARFVAKFGDMTVANYAGRFVGYSGEQFETLGQEDGIDDTRVVKTRLVRPGDEDVLLDYRLHQTGDGWRIIDVYMNGAISELALRRSEYSALLKREGFASLMEALDRTIARLREGAQEG